MTPLLQRFQSLSNASNLPHTSTESLVFSAMGCCSPEAADLNLIDHTTLDTWVGNTAKIRIQRLYGSPIETENLGSRESLTYRIPTDKACTRIDHSYTCRLKVEFDSEGRMLSWKSRIS